MEHKWTLKRQLKSTIKLPAKQAVPKVTAPIAQVLYFSLLIGVFSLVTSSFHQHSLTTDLSKVLPKLQKRISANSNNTSQNVDSGSSQNRSTTKRPSEDGEAPLDFNDIVLEKVAPEVVSALVFCNKRLYFHLTISQLPMFHTAAYFPRTQSEYYPTAPAAACFGNEFCAQFSQRQRHRVGAQLPPQHSGKPRD